MRNSTSPEIRGWSSEKIAEFERYWRAGMPKPVMADYFGCTVDWIYKIRRRRGLVARKPGRPRKEVSVVYD